jgi:hypothetical protein
MCKDFLNILDDIKVKEIDNDKVQEMLKEHKNDPSEVGTHVIE